MYINTTLKDHTSQWISDSETLQNNVPCPIHLSHTRTVCIHWCQSRVGSWLCNVSLSELYRRLLSWMFLPSGCRACERLKLSPHSASLYLLVPHSLHSCPTWDHFFFTVNKPHRLRHHHEKWWHVNSAWRIIPAWSSNAESLQGNIWNHSKVLWYLLIPEVVLKSHHHRYLILDRLKILIPVTIWEGRDPSKSLVVYLNGQIKINP